MCNDVKLPLMGPVRIRHCQTIFSIESSHFVKSWVQAKYGFNSISDTMTMHTAPVGPKNFAIFQSYRDRVNDALSSLEVLWRCDLSRSPARFFAPQCLGATVCASSGWVAAVSLQSSVRLWTTRTLAQLEVRYPFLLEICAQDMLDPQVTGEIWSTETVTMSSAGEDRACSLSSRAQALHAPTRLTWTWRQGRWWARWRAAWSRLLRRSRGRGETIHTMCDQQRASSSKKANS